VPTKECSCHHTLHFFITIHQSTDTHAFRFPFNLFLSCFLHRSSSTSDTLNSWQSISFTSFFSSVFRRFSSVCHVIFKVCHFSLFSSDPFKFVLVFLCSPSLSLSLLFSFLAFYCSCSGSGEEDPGLKRC